MKRPKFIVGEVSKSWHTGDKLERDSQLLCMLFEKIIAVNYERGYILHDFSLNQLLISPDSMTETIIAVFKDAKE